jgi:hypothetical protein
MSDSGFLLLFVLPLALVATLEVLFRQSDQHNGIVEVPATGYSQYFWTYVPGLVMILIEAICTDVDFKIRLLSPYYQLKKGTTSVQHSIMDKSLSKLSATATLSAFKNKHYALAATSFAVLLCSGLTIAVSGLYIPEAVVMQSPTTVAVVDSFLPPDDFGYNIDNCTSGISITMLVKGEMNYPQWTTSQCAIPSLAISSNLTKTKISSLSSEINSLELRVPIWRGNLNCSHIGQESIIIRQPPSVSQTTISYPASENCITFELGNTTAHWYELLGARQPPSRGIWGYWDFILDPESSVGDDGTAACPSVIAWYGNSTSNETFSDLNLLLCYTNIEQVDADIKFSLPDWTVSSLEMDETTSTIVASGEQTVMINNFDAISDNFTTAYPKFDPIFQAMFYNKSESEVDQLLAGSNSSALIQQAISFYQLASSQILNTQARNSSNTTHATINATETFMRNGDLRLKQDIISTRILQGILTSLSFLVAFPVLWLNHDNILPKKPCSIAAVGSLVAGSEMMDLIPPGGEWLGDKELGRLLEGHSFSLGWWGEVDGVKRRFGIDIGEGEWLEGKSRKERFLSWDVRERRRKI